MRRHVCRHADGDACRSVDEKARQLRRKDGRFLERAVVVGLHVDGLFPDIVHHFISDLIQADFRVTHGGGRIAVDGAEVALTVDERIPEGEILDKTDDRIIDG